MKTKKSKKKLDLAHPLRMQKERQRAYRPGSWAQPYLDEILRGGYVHNPSLYIECKYNQHYKRWVRRYNESWYMALGTIKQDLLTIPNHYGGNPIFILKKSFNKLIKKRIIQETNGFTLCRLEDRNCLFRPGQFPEGEFEVVNCSASIEDILTEEVMEVLDGESQYQLIHSQKRRKFPKWVVDVQ
jgi:hypothetical protein